jgi:hypothetical protein
VVAGGSYCESLAAPELIQQAGCMPNQARPVQLAAQDRKELGGASFRAASSMSVGAAVSVGLRSMLALQTCDPPHAWVLLVVCVQDVVALIAYERPEQSPLAPLLQLSQREVVADAVNAAILQVAAAGGAGSSSPGTVATGSSKPQVRRQECVGGGWGAGGHRWASPTACDRNRDRQGQRATEHVNTDQTVAMHME